MIFWAADSVMHPSPLCRRVPVVFRGSWTEDGGMEQPVIQASRIVVVMPNWLGDGVMATPFLRALRQLYPAAHIAAAARPLVAPVCERLVDEINVYGKGEEAEVAKWMRASKFDLAILLPNSLRSAWMTWRGGARRRLGYSRGGRSLLLTDRVRPAKRTSAQRMLDEGKRAAQFVIDDAIAETEWKAAGPAPLTFPMKRMRRIRWLPWCFQGDFEADDRQWKEEVFIPAFQLRPRFGGYQPVPTIEYYLQLARYLGAANAPRQMELAATAANKEEAEKALAQFQISNLKSQISESGDEKIVVLVPGANFGASKCWLPERFAAVAERLADPAGPFGAQVILAGSPTEMAICDAIAAGVSKHPERVHILGRTNGGKGVSIGALKEIVRRSRMMICNDTGPRHIAAAFGVPVVTLFGPTDPVWAETFFEKERIVRVEVPCGPCQLKQCPIDHRCMTRITVEMVMAAAEELWNRDG
jgi:ADP-heptose:LPS heptosyltransferase